MEDPPTPYIDMSLEETKEALSRIESQSAELARKVDWTAEIKRIHERAINLLERLHFVSIVTAINDLRKWNTMTSRARNVIREVFIKYNICWDLRPDPYIDDVDSDLVVSYKFSLLLQQLKVLTPSLRRRFDERGPGLVDAVIEVLTAKPLNFEGIPDREKERADSWWQ